MSGVAARYSECLSFNHFLTLSLPAKGEIEIASSGLRNRQLYPSLAKASASLLPWVPQWPGTQRSVTLFKLDSTNSACQHSQTSFDVTLDT
jgi:hypothetical protein